MSRIVVELERMSRADWLPDEVKRPLQGLCGDLSALATFNRLPPALIVNAEVMAQCLREMEVLSVLSHPPAREVGESVRSLILDLRGQAARIIAQVSRDIRLQADTIMEDDEASPLDLKSAFRDDPLGARPGASMVVATGFGPQDFGTVAGQVLFHLLPEDGRRTAPGDSLILPRGTSLFMAEGETCLVHAVGMQSGSAAADAPETGPRRAVLIEAGKEGARLHGPLVLSPSGLPDFPSVILRNTGEWVFQAWRAALNREQAILQEAHRKEQVLHGLFSMFNLDMGKPTHSGARPIPPTAYYVIPDIADGSATRILDMLRPGGQRLPDPALLKSGRGLDRWDAFAFCRDLPRFTATDQMICIPADLVLTGVHGRLKIFRPVLALPRAVA